MATENFINRDIATKRIQEEITDTESWEKIRALGISVEVPSDNLKLIKGEISGLDGTPYEGGNFIFEINISDRYPLDPPDVRFITKIWHPNICSVSGVTSVFNDWTPSMKLDKIPVVLKELFFCADLDHVMDDEAAKQYKDDPEMFILTAKYWAQCYAGAPGSNSDFDTKIKRLMDVGIDKDTACKILSSCFWDVEKVIESLSHIFASVL